MVNYFQLRAGLRSPVSSREPPIAKAVAMAIDRFRSKKDRRALAAALNALVVSLNTLSPVNLVANVRCGAVAHRGAVASE